MDPRSNNAGTGLPQPGNDMGPLPPIRTPQFHAPDTAAPHFDTAQPQIGAVAPTAQPPAQAMPAMPEPAPATAITTPPQPAGPSPAPLPTASDPQISTSDAGQSAGPVDDNDTAFDEEWVNRAREVVSKTKTDPFTQSQELSKLKAQYIKLRYNKDIKVSE